MRLHNKYSYELTALWLKPRYLPDGRPVPGRGLTVGPHRSVTIDDEEAAATPQTGAWLLLADDEDEPEYPEPVRQSDAVKNAVLANAFPGRPSHR